MVGNIVDVGWATIKSGCLPITAREILSYFFMLVFPETIACGNLGLINDRCARYENPKNLN